MTYTKQQNYLQKGDIIKDPAHTIEYLILDKLGQGGEGVVYKAAINIESSGSHEGLKDGDVVCIKERNRVTAGHEAAALRACQGDQSVVKLYSTFVQGNKEYIVEEYLDGVTLRNYVSSPSREKLSVQDAVNLLYPVGRAVLSMHQKGYVHCDISPDNLIYDTRKKRLVLIDFGFAHNIDNKSPLPQKPIYSPTEFYEEEAYFSSDIYSFCAVLYFCIMGKDPESVTSRSIFDELKRPSEIGIDIKAPMEELLLDKGMALFHEARTASFDELITDMMKYYPEQTPLWMKKQKRRRRILFTVSAALLLAACIAVYLFRTQLYFQFVENQVVALDGSEMTEEEFNDSLPKIKSRLEAFAGKGKYLWKQNGDQITFEVPIELFGDIDPEIITRLAITRPMHIWAQEKVEDKDELQEICPINQTEDVERAYRDDNGMRIVFTEKGRTKMKALLSEEGRAVIFSFDTDQNFRNTASYDARTTGDGESVYLLPGSITIPDDLIAMHFTGEPSAAAFNVRRHWNISWENPTNTMLRGLNQVQENTLRGETAEYRYRNLSSTEEISGFSAGELSGIAVIKNRLDSLKIPYAIGHDRFTTDCVIVKMPKQLVWEEEIENLGSDTDFEIGSKYAASDKSTNIDSIKVIVNEDGSLSIAVTPSSYDMENIQKTIQSILDQDLDDLGLYFNNELVALGNAESNLANLGEDGGELIFDRWNKEDYIAITNENRHFADFLCTCFVQDPQVRYGLDNLILQDEFGNTDPFYLEETVLEEGTVESEEDSGAENEEVSITLSAEDYIARWEADDSFGNVWEYYPNMGHLMVDIYPSDISHPEVICHSMERWLKENEEVVNSGMFQRFVFAFYEDEEHASEKIQFSMDMDFDTSHMQITTASVRSEDQDKKDRIAEELNKCFSESPILCEYMPETPNGQVFKASSW